MIFRKFWTKCMDSHHVDADPDLDSSFILMWMMDLDPDLKFNFIQNRILLFIKVMQNCNHWSTGPPRLHFKRLQLLNFDFDADRIRLAKMMLIHADPDPRLWYVQLKCTYHNLLRHQAKNYFHYM